jgi:putative endonuclease
MKSEGGGAAPRKRARSAKPRPPTDRQLLVALAPSTYDESGFRTDTHTAGQGGETRATSLLTREGYTIVERNYRCNLGELDIIARDGDVLAFVEVRTRANDSHGHAAEMVTRDKQQQVTRVAECYLLDRKPRDEHMRFDVVAITGDTIDLIKDAWRL